MLRPFVLFGLLLATAGAAAAQDVEPPKDIPFEGGTFTITQNEDFERVLTYDGKEIARNYMVFYDRMVKLGETNVALFSVGDGGNACGASEVIAWKVPEKGLRTVVVGDDCDGAPPVSVGDSQLYFVPYLLPGASRPLLTWSPETGLRTGGTLTFTPQPDTSWETLDTENPGSMIAAFDNAAIYEAGKALLGDRFGDVIAGLLTGGDAEKQPDGTITGYGCVPHSCGVSDTFMAIDPRAKKLYFAQQNSDAGKPDAWPDLAGWPEALKTAMAKAIGNSQ